MQIKLVKQSHNAGLWNIWVTPLYYRDNCQYYYFQHFQVIELLIKAIAADEDANDFTARLLQYHKDHPQDIIACLSLAIAFKDDELVCAQYQEAARAINGAQYNEYIQMMEMIAFYVRNIATIDTSCLKRARRFCVLM